MPVGIVRTGSNQINPMDRPFRLERSLKYEIGGKIEQGTLSVGNILWLPERKKWVCEWSISFIHPEIGRLYGDDPLEALTVSLDFLSDLIRGSQRDGLPIWWKTKGDGCGLVFRLSEKKNWEGMKL